ncbi:MAG: hypothetical protein ABIJ96_10065 [Elusimicrobiota bacterium]
MNRIIILTALCAIFAAPAGAEEPAGPVGEPFSVAAVESFKHPTCEIMPWGVLTAVQVKKTVNYSWDEELDIKALFAAKGYRSSGKLVSTDKLPEGALFTYMVTSVGKETRFFRTQYLGFTIIHIRVKDSSTEGGSRILFQYKPPTSMMQSDPHDITGAQVNSIRVALRGIPNCEAEKTPPQD